MTAADRCEGRATRRGRSFRGRRTCHVSVCQCLMLLIPVCHACVGTETTDGSAEVSLRTVAKSTTYSAGDLAYSPTLKLVRAWASEPEVGPTSGETIAGIVVGEDRRIYVLDGADNVVHVFDPTGQHVGTIGGAGQGPGEMRGSIGLAIAGDTLLVLDQMDRTLERFTTDGRSVGSSRGIVHDSLFKGIEHFVQTTAGLALTQRRGSIRVQDTVMIRFVDLTSGVAGPFVVVLPRPRNYVTGRSRLSRPLFAAMPNAVASPTGQIYSTTGEQFLIEVVSPTGERIERIDADIPREPVSADDVRRVLGRRRRANPDNDYDALPRSEFHPTLGRILVDPAGRLLIERLDLVEYTAEGELPDSSAWLMIAPNRRIEGRLKIPRRFVPYVFVDCGVVGVELGNFDVPTIARYRIVRVNDRSSDAGAAVKVNGPRGCAIEGSS